MSKLPGRRNSRRNRIPPEVAKDAVVPHGTPATRDEHDAATAAPHHQDPKRRIGQFETAGEHSMTQNMGKGSG
jgi:hypothetical protein